MPRHGLRHRDAKNIVRPIRSVSPASRRLIRLVGPGDEGAGIPRSAPPARAPDGCCCAFRRPGLSRLENGAVVGRNKLSFASGPGIPNRSFWTKPAQCAYVRFLPSGDIAPYRVAHDLTQRQRKWLQALAGSEAISLRRTPSPGRARDAGTDSSRRPPTETPWPDQFQGDGTRCGVVLKRPNEAVTPPYSASFRLILDSCRAGPHCRVRSAAGGEAANVPSAEDAPDARVACGRIPQILFCWEKHRRSSGSARNPAGSGPGSCCGETASPLAATKTPDQ